MAFDNKVFADEAKWLAFERNSFEWPKAWRAVIFKIKRFMNPIDCKEVYIVYPRNPDYQIYLDDIDVHALKPGGLAQIPPMHLGAVEFDTMDDINNWATVAWRIK